MSNEPLARQYIDDQLKDVGWNLKDPNNVQLEARETESGICDYILKDDRSNPLKGKTGTISDYSNVPYENVVYENINSVGRQWIRRYTLALAKEMLGYIRGKYSSLPIPNAEITLNGSDLISAATTEKEGLITELKEILDTMSRQAQLERKQAEAEALQSQFNKMPMKIYIG